MSVNLLNVCTPCIQIPIYHVYKINTLFNTTVKPSPFTYTHIYFSLRILKFINQKASLHMQTMFDQFFYISRVIKSDYRNILSVNINQPACYHFILNFNKIVLRSSQLLLNFLILERIAEYKYTPSQLIRSCDPLF